MAASYALGQIFVLHLSYTLRPEYVPVAGYAPLALGGTCQKIIDRAGALFLEIILEVPGGLQTSHGGE